MPVNSSKLIPPASQNIVSVNGGVTSVWHNWLRQFSTQAIQDTAALSVASDTNITLATSGSPSTALINAATITASWSGTLAVARGGTGRASHTAYAVICGGTTSTGAQQSIASVGTSGQFLKSNGANALPTFQTVDIPTAASVDDMEAGTSTTVYTSPGRQYRHAGHPKWWITLASGFASFLDGYNIASVTDNGTGRCQINLSFSFFDTNYGVVLGIGDQSAATNTGYKWNYVRTSSSAISIVVQDIETNAAVDTEVTAVGFGGI